MAILDPLQDLPAQWERMARGYLDPLIQQAKFALQRAKAPIDSSYKLGLELTEEGQLEEALLRFKFVLWKRPTHASSLYQSALCHFGLNRKYEGLKFLNRALVMDPKNEEALYLKATIEDGKYAETYAPHTTPVPFVKQEFAHAARKYDSRQLEQGYRGDAVLFQTILQLLAKHPPPPRPEKILDIGCGTGLCGALISSMTTHLIGLDVCQEMLNVARRKQGHRYVDFIEADLRDHLLQQKAPLYDMITAMNVMPIIGGLAPVVDGAARALKPGGYLIFSCYALRATGGYRFIHDIRRFAHSSHYLKTQAERAGFKPVSLTETQLYEKDSRPSYMVVLQK